MTPQDADTIRPFRPGRREAVASALVVFVAALGVRLWAASVITFPAPEDTAYYVAAARSLLEGHGLVSGALWSYATPPLVFPRPAFEVWLPLPSFLAAIPMALLGHTFGAAQWSAMLVGSTVAVLGWRLAADVAAEAGLPAGRARSVAVGTGLTAAVYLPLVLHSALPDSTMPFAALALAACLLMGRLARAGSAAAESPSAAGGRILPLVTLGVLMGLAALTRNEAAWLALAWVVIVWRLPLARRERVRRIAVVGVAAFLVFVPWAVRDWLVFGNPLPGQALLNALSVDGRDIFAWQEQPTLARYLAAGPQVWVGTRVTGVLHNLLNVLLLFGMPMSLIGLLALPLTVRFQATWPLAIVAGITFTLTSLLFPVATTWGTFLHAAGPVHVLLILSCLMALDRGIAWVGRRRAWTRPVAWLGPALTIAAGALFTAALLPTFGAGGRHTEAKFDHLRAVLAQIGPEGGAAGPIITDYPIWLADIAGVPALALPNESPQAVLDLARHFPGTRLVIVDDALEGGGRWPGILDQSLPGSECFQPVVVFTPADPLAAKAVERTRIYRIACP